jgi:DNA excision repair protein ERCC-2
MDFGVRILMDSRYQGSLMRRLGKFSVFQYFPPEERKEFIDIAPSDVGGIVEDFFAHIASEDAKKGESEFSASKRPNFGSFAQKL